MAVNIKKTVSGKQYASGTFKGKASVYEKFLTAPGTKLSGLETGTVKAALHSSEPNLPHKEVVGKTNLQKKVSGEVVHSGQTTETVLKAVASGPNYAKVGCSGGRTMQPAPFESVKIDVWIEVPCPNDSESINQAYDFASDWVSEKLQEAEAAFKGSAKTVTVAAYPDVAKEAVTSGYVQMNEPTATTFMAAGGGGSMFTKKDK